MESRKPSIRSSSVSHMFCVLQRSIIPHFLPDLRQPTRDSFPSAERMISPIVIWEGCRARMNPPPPRTRTPPPPGGRRVDFPPPKNAPPRNADHGGVRRDLLVHHRAGPD